MHVFDESGQCHVSKFTRRPSIHKLFDPIHHLLLGISSQIRETSLEHPHVLFAPPVSSYISFTAFTLRHNISILIVVAFSLNLLAIFQGFAAWPCFPEQSRHHALRFVENRLEFKVSMWYSYVTRFEGNQNLKN